MKYEKTINKIKMKTYRFTYDTMVGIHRLDKDSADYNKYEIAYGRWFKGEITNQEFSQIVDGLIK